MVRDQLRFGTIFSALVLSVILSGTAVRAQEATGGNAPVKLAPGTQIAVRMSTPLNSSLARMGQEWTGTLANNVAVGDQVAASQGAPVTGIVVAAKNGGRMKGKASISMQVTSVNGITTLTDTLTKDSTGHTKSNLGYIGGNAAMGAGIGSIAGGASGAGIGAATGAATGTVGAAMTGKRSVEIPPETVLTFTVK